VEDDYMKMMKDDRTLWDGARLMKPEPRERWEKFLEGLKEEAYERQRLKWEKAAQLQAESSAPLKAADCGRKRTLDGEDDVGSNQSSKRSRHR
jgi:hypothetical protein